MSLNSNVLKFLCKCVYVKVCVSYNVSLMVLVFIMWSTLSCHWREKCYKSWLIDWLIDRSENGRLQNVTYDFFVYLYFLDDSSIPSYVRSIFMRLDQIETSLSNIANILMKDMPDQDIEIEELSRQLTTLEELEEACEKLGDVNYKKKVVRAMLLLLCVKLWRRPKKYCGLLLPPVSGCVYPTVSHRPLVL